MDETLLEKILKGKRISFQVGSNSGDPFPLITKTETLYLMDNWKLDDDTLDEFLKYVNACKDTKPKRLTDADINLVNGQSYRGTNIFYTIVACYSTGAAYGIKDYTLYNPKNTSINIKSILVTSDKNYAAQHYATNRYMPIKDTPISKNIKHIFHRILTDNGQEIIEAPDFFQQPILLAFNQKGYHNDVEMKHNENEIHEPKPNLSSLELLARLSNKELQSFKDAYPILSSCFTD